MARQSLDIKDFSGGLNNATDERDLKGNEFVEFTNATNRVPGQLSFLGHFSDEVINLDTDPGDESHAATDNLQFPLPRHVLTYVGSTYNRLGSIIAGQGAFSHVSNNSFAAHLNSADVSFEISNLTRPARATYSYADFSIDTLVWVVSTGNPSNLEGSLTFTLGIEDGPAGIDGGAWTVLDVNGSGSAVNEFDNSTFINESGTTSVVNTDRGWSVDARKNQSKYSNGQILGDDGYYAFGFLGYMPLAGTDTNAKSIMMPEEIQEIGALKTKTLTYALMKKSFANKLVAKINATTTSPNFTAAIIDDNSTIRITCATSGTSLNGKKLVTTLSASGDIVTGGHIVATPTIITNNFTSATMAKSTYGACDISGDFVLKGGKAGVKEKWKVSIEGDVGNNTKVAVHLDSKVVGGHSGSINENGYTWSGNASDIAGRIATDLNSISGITGASISGTTTTAAFTAESDALGQTQGFNLSVVPIDDGHSITTQSGVNFTTNSKAEEQIYLLTKTDINAVYQGYFADDTTEHRDIYEIPLFENYLHQASETCHNWKGIDWSIYSSDLHSWIRVGEEETIWNETRPSGNTTIASWEGTNQKGIMDWLWYDVSPGSATGASGTSNQGENQSEYNPEVNFTSYKNTVLVSDGNFNLPNYNMFIKYIDRSDFFSPTRIARVDGWDEAAVLPIEEEFNNSEWNFINADGFWQTQIDGASRYRDGDFSKWYKYPSSKNWKYTLNPRSAYGPLNQDTLYEGTGMRMPVWENKYYPNWNPSFPDRDGGSITYTGDSHRTIIANDMQGLHVASRHNLPWETPSGSDIYQIFHHSPMNPELCVDFFNIEPPGIEAGEGDQDWDQNFQSGWEPFTIAHFYASAVYDDGSESQPGHRFQNADWQTNELTQTPYDFCFNYEVETDEEVINYQRYLGMQVHCCPYKEGLSDPKNGNGKSAFPDPRMVGIRLYMTLEEDSHELYYSLGIIDFRSGFIKEGDNKPSYVWLEKREAEVVSGNDATQEVHATETAPEKVMKLADVYLNETYESSAGAENGYWAGNLVVDTIIHFQTPPTGDTYQSIHGYDPKDIQTLDVRYKTSVVAGNRMFAGNILYVEDGKNKIADDAIVYSPVGQIDILPYPTNVITASTGDGDEIIKLATFNGKILEFKRRHLYIHDISSGLPETFFLESKHTFKGVLSQNHVCTTEEGIFWISASGTYFYYGEEIKNLLQYDDGDNIRLKINLQKWSDFITDESSLGYNPETKEIIITKRTRQRDSQDSDKLNDGDMYVFNINTQSWSFGDDRNRLSNYDYLFSAIFKHSTNFINVGNKNKIFKFDEVNEMGSETQSNIATGKYWNYKYPGSGPIHFEPDVEFNINDAMNIVTKVFTLGDIWSPKSFLSHNINFLQGTTSMNSIYSAENPIMGGILYIRRDSGEVWNQVGLYIYSQSTTTSSDINLTPMSFRRILGYETEWGNLQFRFWVFGHRGWEYAVNDLSFLYRNWREISSKASLDEE